MEESNFYDDVSPSSFFLQQLSHPHNVQRSKVYIKKSILKLNSWTNNYLKWREKNFFAGDTIEKVGLLREFSISQFTYQDKEQYLAIQAEAERNKRRYNQTYEGFFTDENGILDYQTMIEVFDQAIADGAHSINDLLDKSRNRHKNSQISHPEAEVYAIIKERVNEPTIAIEDLALNDIDWNMDLEDDEFANSSKYQMEL